MAVLRCSFFSDVLELSTSMTVVLPDTADPQPDPGADGPPLLYLLHGLSDDDTAWTRNTRVEGDATARGIAVVMPQVHRSFYADEAFGGMPFWTFLSEELPTVIHRMFRLSQRPDQTFVAGLSMGGYGAMKWALRQPERFAAAASLSGALGLGELPIPRDEPLWQTLRHALGDQPRADDNVLHLLRTVDPSSIPALFVGCGVDDDLLGESEAFVAIGQERGIGITTSYRPGGHDWQYWDMAVREVLAWLPLSERTEA